MTHKKWFQAFKTVLSYTNMFCKKPRLMKNGFKGLDEFYLTPVFLIRNHVYYTNSSRDLKEFDLTPLFLINNHD